MKLGLASVIAIVACAPQVDGNFGGDAIVSLHGDITGFPSDARIDGGAIRWNTQIGSDIENGPTTLTPARLTPPHDVDVDIIDMPTPDVEFMVGDGATIAEGYLMVVGDGKVTGEAIDYAVIYLDADAPAGSLAAGYVGGAMQRGYHLCVAQATVSVPAAQQPFVDACGGTPECVSQRRYALRPIPLVTTMQFFPGGP